MNLPSINRMYVCSNAATVKYREAFGIINDNMSVNIKSEWLHAINILELARHTTYSPYRKAKCTTLIRLCNAKLAGVVDYSSLGIGYYAGGRAITRSEFVTKMNKTTQRRRKGQ